MGLKEKLLTSTAYFMSFGALGYMLGGVSQQIFSSVTPQLAGAIFGLSAVAVELAKGNDNQNKKN